MPCPIAPIYSQWATSPPIKSRRVTPMPHLGYGITPSVFICVHLWLNSPVPVRANARKLGTEYQLNMSAQRALMRRAFSIHEMKKYLEGRAENKDFIPPVIARLRELNYL